MAYYRLRYAVYIDLVQQGSGPMAGQLAVEGSATGSGGSTTIACFNGGINSTYPGALFASGNQAPQILGSGTNAALAAADLSTLLMGAATITGAGNGVTTLNLANDIYSQWTSNGGNNPIQLRTTQMANPGAFGVG
jgi:hypothetical protein